MRKDRLQILVQMLLVAVLLFILAVAWAGRDTLADRWREFWLSTGTVAFVVILLAFGGWRLNREIRERVATAAELAEKVTALQRAASERDEAYAALSASQARFQTIMDHAPVAVLLKDLEFRYTFVNRAFETWSGWSAADVIGKTALEVLPRQDGEFQIAHAREVIAKRAPVQREVTISLPAGTRTALYIKFPIFGAGGTMNAIGGIAVDITGLKQMEAQLTQSQKMEAVGQLTGGIAHDFNNLLTAILINADILVQQLGSDQNLQRLAQVTLEAAERGAELTSRLLAFSRRQMLEARTVDVNALIVEMEQLMQRSLGEHVSIALALKHDLQPAHIDPHQLETALLNLAVNARDAMPDGGSLTIETSNAMLDEGYARTHAEVQPGEYVMVAVSDTGTGMPPEVAARAFEPFFTTKGVGRGTGLGLSMVYGFVKQSSGHVKIYSEEGHGTSVKIYLPRATGLQQTMAEALVSVDIEGGNETVLVVEDDKLVRRYVMTQIESLGYTTLEATNASEALHFIDQARVIDLLFTDVIMPGIMNGRQLVDEALKRRPGLKTLFTSGYTENAIVHHGRLDSGVLLLAKPYRKSELARMIRLALASLSIPQR